MNFSKNVNNNKDAPKLIFFNKKEFRKIRIIFDIENWLWKSKIIIFWSLDLEWVLIWQNIFLWKSAIFHSINLSFDAQVAEKILNVIYCAMTIIWRFLWIGLCEDDDRNHFLIWQKFRSLILKVTSLKLNKKLGICHRDHSYITWSHF